MMETKTRVNAEPNRLDIVITREFDLPVEVLFKAHTEAEYLAQWMETRVLELDSRQAGRFQLETSRNGAVVFRAHGVIHEIVPDRSIVRTFEIDNPAVGIRLEYLEFEKVGAQTSRLTMRLLFKTEQHRAAQLRLPFAAGLNLAHNRLQELLPHLI